MASKKKNDFGSVKWQNEQSKNIKEKLKSGEKLSGKDKTFIEVQLMHNMRLKKLPNLRKVL